MKADDQDFFDDADIVSRVRDILGARLTAYIAGVQETRAVRAWVGGTDVPPPQVMPRLRLAYALADRMTAREGKQVAQVWFMGLNPHLHDRSPAEVIRESEPNLVEYDVARALGAFFDDR